MTIFFRQRMRKARKSRKSWIQKVKKSKFDLDLAPVAHEDDLPKPARH